MRFLHLRRTALLSLGVLLSLSVSAQPEMPPTRPLELAPDPAVGSGTVAMVQGTATPEGYRFSASGFRILQPLAAAVQTRSAGDNVRLVVTKAILDSPERSCATEGEGACAVYFRTEGDVFLRVEADTPTDYQLILWAGEEAELSVPTLFVPAAGFDESSLAGSRANGAGATEGASGGLLLWIIVALLAVGVVLLVVLVLRRGRPRGVGVWVLAASLGAGVATEAAAQARPVGTADLWRGREANQASASERQSTDNEVRRGQRSGARSGLNSAIDLIVQGQAWAASGESMLDAFDGLTPEDGGYTPDYDPRGAPDLPSACADDPACEACFAPAYETLTLMRRKLEKLRAIYQGTEDFAAAALSFGDDVSPIHGLSGLAWQTERRNIEASLGGLRDAYDNKYGEFIDGLHGSLQAIGQCEAEVHGVEGWYERYGFIYFSFMQDRYRREGYGY